MAGQAAPCWHAVICSLCGGECVSGVTHDPSRVLRASGRTIAEFLDGARVSRAAPEAGICSACHQLVVSADELSAGLEAALEALRSRALAFSLPDAVVTEVGGFGCSDPSSSSVLLAVELDASPEVGDGEQGEEGSSSPRVAEDEDGVPPKAAGDDIDDVEFMEVEVEPGDVDFDPGFGNTASPKKEHRVHNSVFTLRPPGRKDAKIAESPAKNKEQEPPGSEAQCPPTRRSQRKLKSIKLVEIRVPGKNQQCKDDRKNPSTGKATSSEKGKAKNKLGRVEGGSPVTCDCCQRQWRDSIARAKHISYMKSRDEKLRPKECPVCGKSFRNLSAHMLQVHGEVSKPFCSDCNESFPKADDWRLHRFRVHGIGEDPTLKNVCRVCGKKFGTNGGRDFNRHMARVHGEALEPGSYFVCDVCGKQFFSRHALEEHRSSHSGVRPFPCPLCAYAATRRSLVFDHVRKVHKMTPAEARKRFIFFNGDEQQENDPNVASSNQRGAEGTTSERRSDLQPRGDPSATSTSTVAAVSADPFPCPKCERLFDTALERHEHVKAEHEDVLVCECCGKSFVGKTSLRKHLHHRARKGKRSFCDLCGKDVVYLYQHKYEMHGVQAQPPPKCDSCGLQLLNGKKLRLHKFLAHGVGRDPRKRYTCDSCPRVFAHPNKLREHRFRDHEVAVPDDKVHKCDECGKVFFARYLLTEHANLHMGLKPFKCPSCPFETTGRGSLRAHERNVHGRKMAATAAAVKPTS